MKKLSFIILTICTFSCTKIVEKQNLTSNSQNQSSAIAGRDGEKFPISLMWYHIFESFIRDCVPGAWYCWQIGSPVDNLSYIKIDQKEQLITFGIDNSTDSSAAYNSQFMVEDSNFKFPQDTLNTELTHAACGSDDMMYVKEGLYHYDIIDKVVTITVPYSIAR